MINWNWHQIYKHKLISFYTNSLLASTNILFGFLICGILGNPLREVKPKEQSRLTFMVIGAHAAYIVSDEDMIRSWKWLNQMSNMVNSALEQAQLS